MKLRTEHHYAIEQLVQHRFTSLAHRLTHAEIAAQCGITERTLRNWRADADFQTALREAIETYKRDLGAVRFIHKRARLEELERLYGATPDAYIYNVIELKGPAMDSQGRVIMDSDGKPVTTIAVQRMNVDVKARILDQIAEEVGDKMQRKLLVHKSLEEEDDPKNLTDAELLQIIKGAGGDRTMEPAPRTD